MPVKVYFINIKNLSDKAVFSFYPKLTAERKEKVDRLRFGRDKRLSVMAEVLLGYAVGKEGIAFPERVLTGENGKPYIDGIFFNISHSEDYVVCAVSKEEVGCDIEKITDINIDIAKRFFSKEEYGRIIALENEREKSKLFFRLWTLKESYLKAIGSGLKKPLDSFTVNTEKEIKLSKKEEEDFCFSEYKRIRGYALSVCSKKGEVNFFKVRLKDIKGKGMQN